MFAEYEKAQILERYRRGKPHRARAGSVNVLSGAPFGYRYVRKSEHAGAGYEIVRARGGPGRRAVPPLRRRGRLDRRPDPLADRAAACPPAPARPAGTASVVWGMLRNPAYAGRAVFGKTMAVHESPGLNRRARLAGRVTPRAGQDRRPAPRGVGRTSPSRQSSPRRPSTGSRSGWKTTNASPPATAKSRPCCRAWPPAPAADTATTAPRPAPPTRRSTTTGAWARDDYRYEGGRVCANKPVRADYLDQVVWDHITGLLADPHLIRAEIDKRLHAARTADPATPATQRLELALAKATTAITRMIEAFSEQLITIDELRTRMPDLRARETNLRNQIDAIDAQLADRERLPQTRRRPAKASSPNCAPTPQTATVERTPTRTAAARQRRPHRPREDHHPAPHPRPRAHYRQHPALSRHRHGG